MYRDGLRHVFHSFGLHPLYPIENGDVDLYVDQPNKYTGDLGSERIALLGELIKQAKKDIEALDTE